MGGKHFPEVIGKHLAPLSVGLGDVGTPASLVETVLRSTTIPVGALNANSKRIEGHAWGFFAANANVKTIRVRAGAVTLVGTVLNAQPTANPNGMRWEIRFKIIRTAEDVQTTFVVTQFSAAGAGTASNNHTINTALALNDGADFLVEITGQNGTAAPNDIVCSGMTVDVMDAP